MPVSLEMFDSILKLDIDTNFKIQFSFNLQAQD